MDFRPIYGQSRCYCHKVRGSLAIPPCPLPPFSMLGPLWLPLYHMGRMTGSSSQVFRDMDTFVPSPAATEQQTAPLKAGQDVQYTCLPASLMLVAALVRISVCDMSAYMSEARQRQAADKQADCSFVVERGCHVAAAKSISQQVFLPSPPGLQLDSA